MDLALGDLYSERAVASGVSTERADLIFASLPYRIMAGAVKPAYDEAQVRDKEYYDGLRAAGFDLDFGVDDSGLFMKYLRRGSGLLHRRRRGPAGHRRAGPGGPRPGRPPHRGRGGARRRHVAPGGRRRLCDRVPVDERVPRDAHLDRGRRPGGQGLGLRVRHAQGPRTVGGRAAQHVEADQRRRTSGSTAATCTSRGTTRSSSRCSCGRGTRASTPPSTGCRSRTTGGSGVAQVPRSVGAACHAPAHGGSRRAGRAAARCAVDMARGALAVCGPPRDRERGARPVARARDRPRGHAQRGLRDGPDDRAAAVQPRPGRATGARPGARAGRPVQRGGGRDGAGRRERRPSSGRRPHRWWGRSTPRRYAGCGARCSSAGSSSTRGCCRAATSRSR